MAQTTQKRLPQLEAALLHAPRGWSVIPIEPSGKKPLLPWADFQQRRATEAEIAAWWQRWPAANVGIVTGAISGIVVLDVDGKPGEDTLRKEKLHIPATVVAKTGGGGWHYFYKHPGFPCHNFAGKAGKTILPGVDFRGDGGYVVAAPSIHKSGDCYEWAISPDTAEMAEMPEWLADAIRSQAGGEGGRLAPGDWEKIIPDGQRNHELTRYAGSLIAKLPLDTALPLLKAWNEKYCQPPLAENEVEAIVVSIAKKEERKQKTEAPPGPPSTGDNLTDLGNADRLIRLHGEDMCFCYPWNRWLVWSGQRWKKDDSGKVDRMAEAAVRSIYAEAAAELSKEKRLGIIKHARNSENANKVKAMLDRAKNRRPVLPEQFDGDKWLLNVQNGTINLRTGKLMPHRREDWISKICAVEYAPQASYAIWEKFLARVTDNDKELMSFLKRAAGYSLTGDTSEHCLFFLHGDGRNGKSVFQSVLEYVLGDYAKTARSEMLMAKKQGDAIPNEIAALMGIRFVSTTESESGNRLAEASLKQWTGDDTISARFLHAEFFTFKPQFKLFLVSNHKPVIRGQDQAIWERVHLLPFTVYIPPEERDKQLAEKLRNEGAGILRWAVEGCLEWQKNGLRPPDIVRAATEGYKNEMDVLAEFILDKCIVQAGATVGNALLWDAYTTWCRDNGEKYPVSRRAFKENLERRGIVQKRTGIRFWSGIGLVSNVPEEEDVPF